MSDSNRHLHQVIVRIDVVDGLRRDELVLDEHRGRHRAAMEDVERDGDDLGAVLLRESTRPIRSAGCPACGVRRALRATRSDP